METSVRLLERLGGKPTDDDWRWLDDLLRRSLFGGGDLATHY